MAKTWSVYNLSPEIKLKLHLLAVGRGVTIAKLIEQLVLQAWEADKTTITKEMKRKMKRIIKKWS